MLKKIIITGASGFVGQQLVPILLASGCDLLLVGRDRSVLASKFPGLPSCSYSEMEKYGQGFDALVHLAVLNNGSVGADADFQAANVDLLEETLTIAKRIGLKKFINFTSFHAIDGKNTGYANSKRAALAILDKEENIAIMNVFLPAVHGTYFAGKMSFLNKIPFLLRHGVYSFLSALTPTVHVKHIAKLLVTDDVSNYQSTFVYNDQDHNIFYRFTKRLIDLSVAFLLLILIGWIIVVFWFLVRISSDGPGFFVQSRIGKNGMLFNCYKIRTMKVGTKQAGTHELDSDAITWIGSFLRRTKLDELPQILNIFKGELSLVGPRPGLPVQMDLRRAREKYGVYAVLPGLTGLAQISGVDMSNAERLARLDAEYIARRSLLFDLKIIFATALGRGQGDRIR